MFINDVSLVTLITMLARAQDQGTGFDRAETHSERVRNDKFAFPTLLFLLSRPSHLFRASFLSVSARPKHVLWSCVGCLACDTRTHILNIEAAIYGHPRERQDSPASE